MIDCRRIAIAIILFTLLPFISVAQEASSQSEIIGKIVEETSVTEELNLPIDELQNEFSQNPFGLPSETNEQMIDLYSEAFEPESTESSIRSTFKENFNSEYAESVANWMDEENIREVLKLEDEFYTLQGVRKRIVSKYELEQNPPDEKRVQLVQSLAQKRSAAETEIEARAIIFRALVTAFGKLSDQQSFSSSQIEGIVGNFRNQMQSQIDEQVTQHLLAKYHGLDDELLKQYISFYDTEPGQWLTNTTSESIHAALESAADRFLSSIDEINAE